MSQFQFVTDKQQKRALRHLTLVPRAGNVKNKNQLINSSYQQQKSQHDLFNWYQNFDAFELDHKPMIRDLPQQTYSKPSAGLRRNQSQQQVRRNISELDQNLINFHRESENFNIRRLYQIKKYLLSNQAPKLTVTNQVYNNLLSILGDKNTLDMILKVILYTESDGKVAIDVGKLSQFMHRYDTFKFKKNGHKDELKSFGQYFCNERNLQQLLNRKFRSAFEAYKAFSVFGGVTKDSFLLATRNLGLVNCESEFLKITKGSEVMRLADLVAYMSGGQAKPTRTSWSVERFEPQQSYLESASFIQRKLRLKLNNKVKQSTFGIRKSYENNFKSLIYYQ